MRPVVALGSGLSQRADGTRKEATFGSSLVLGAATGMLWAPCTGRILGLLLTGTALNGASLGTSRLLLAYAEGAATSLAIALLIGGRVFAAMKCSLGAGEWIRRGLGVAVLAGVAALAFGLDTGVLARVSLASTNGLEQALVDQAHATTAEPMRIKQDAAVMNAGPSMMMIAAVHQPSGSCP
jgi:hypothetical protein